MSKTRASASSRVPNTEKQMKARGRRPSAFICVFSNETIRNYVVTCFLKSNNDKLRSVSFCPSPKKNTFTCMLLSENLRGERFKLFDEF